LDDKLPSRSSALSAKALWIGWRRDIVRLAVLCGAALLVGIAINRGTAAARRGLATVVPRGVGRLVADLDDDDEHLTGKHTATDPWAYRGRLAAGQLVSIRNARGPITVAPASGDSLIVTAVKTFDSSDPEDVKVVTVKRTDGIAICALWDDEHARCGSGDDYVQGHTHHSDVAVAFDVRVPRGARVEATTVAGAVHVSGAHAPVIAGSVRGDVSAETSEGPVRAFTVDGSVSAFIRGFADTGEVKLTTVNGAVTLELPPALDASISANAVNGTIESDFPLSESQKVVVHHAEGTIGAGGRRIELNAVNGSIRVKKARPQAAH